MTGKNENQNPADSVITQFALTDEQLMILYSFEYYKTYNDIQNEKSQEKFLLKTKWLLSWTKSVLSLLSEKTKNENSEIILKIIPREKLNDAVLNEYKNNKNKLWYFLVVLESQLFIPYYPLDGDEKTSNVCKKMKFKNNLKFIEEIVTEQKLIDKTFVDRVNRCFAKSVQRLTGSIPKIIIAALITLVVTAATFGLAAVLAGPIAIALIGSEFAGLSGAALTSACLAAIGGGAIAVGGGGMALGILYIAGGGALLGFGIGGTAAGGISLMMLTAPDFALLQTAKLEVVIKEIILNSQHDIRFAQEILSQYEDKIKEYEHEFVELKHRDSENKETIIKIKQSIEYLKKSYEDLIKFTSSFELGMNIDESEF